MKQILKKAKKATMQYLSGSPAALVQEFSPISGDQAQSSSILMSIVLMVIVGAVAWKVLQVYQHRTQKDDTKTLSMNQEVSHLHSIITTVCIAFGVFLLSLQTMHRIAPFHGEYGVRNAAICFGLIAALTSTAQVLFSQTRRYVFAFYVGTVMTFILIGLYYMLFDPMQSQDPFFMSLSVLCILLSWKFLFGPWSPEMKATVLGTAILWIGLHRFFSESPEEAGAHILATIIALIPAVIWCILFLKEHRQRLSLVFLMFFSGMLSTAPILFYDAMVRHQTELHFFIFRIVPENFSRSSDAFVTGNLVGVTGLKSTLAITLVSFLIVGVIEECSKFWVLKRSGKRFFSSIDDVLQLGIIVAIGFAFAENVLNPSYFLAFVKQHLINPVAPNWGAFFGNVLGRSILTNMVHILSTGVISYFYGLALFADPVLEEEHKEGHTHHFLHFVCRLVRIPEGEIYRKEMMIVGMVSAVVLHGLFNFLVTLPDILPGNPHTIGDLLGVEDGSFLHMIALLIIPSLFYVVGGLWILSALFYRKESMKERGVIVESDRYIEEETFYADLAGNTI